ncbi:NYN domain-containing protein [Ectobacillus antri]|jgi:predicted RNA-binding protein with PIN domain|uniref:NYN domain-containing protein n=1 Tax=Ectobacillus antri TaxID=2486280 RepID=A0ABT6H767_9BACI|nr:NYN domain-containing protein [Ectobacillus antri]MDG4657847.1 NYN domain-containing protein [Ectobacillus antri]MDG5754900.1 NYN domain-containing protein [Ectobacillus antri]
MKEILIVDGYNIIGAWEDLRKLRDDDLQAARDMLIDKMADYQGYTGTKVIIVFDAHFVQGIEKKIKQAKVEIIFTRKNQTADEKIEQLARELKQLDTRIHVATSDYTEQWIIFAQGALRKSARELEIEVKSMEKRVRSEIAKEKSQKGMFESRYSKEITEKLEKLRRGER